MTLPARIVCALGLIVTTLAPLAGEPVRLSNSSLQIAFHPETGKLIEFAALEPHYNWIESTTDFGLWQIRMEDPASGKIMTLEPSIARSFEFQRIERSSVQLIWSHLQQPFAPDLRVVVTVSIGMKNVPSRWRIAVQNCQRARIQEVRFPRIGNIAKQEEERLAVPLWMGQCAANPRSLLNKGGALRELKYDYPGHSSLQCVAWYSQNGPGLYLSCDDTNAFHKVFTLSGGSGEAARYSLVQLPENTIGNTGGYSQPYDALVGVFRGDWITAAQTYRAWATNQYWALQSRLSPDSKRNWAQSTALWVWNRGRSSDVLKPAAELQKELGLPVSAMWHWWHGCAYDIDFPEYLPPREGAEPFSKALAVAHRQNIHAIVYMNQRLWGMTTDSWRDLEASKYAVLGADGKVRPEIYNTFTKSPCASMCMHTPFWRNHYATLAQEAVALGVDGIYMDQACSSLACYNPDHGHPIGGGTYWMNGFRLLATDIRNRAASTRRSRGLALAGEGVGESWLPYLDLMLSLQVSKERYAGPDGWEPIPFFQAVYHPYVLQYGNYSSLTMPPYDELWPAEYAPEEPLKLLDRRFSTQFYLEQARAFVWGQQPTIANFRPVHLRERREELSYVLRLAKTRERSLKFLRDGVFMRAPFFEVERRVVDISRLSIYAGQQGGLSVFEKEVPMVLAGAWLAPDGKLGVALASASEKPISLRLDFRKTGYVPAQGAIYRIDERGRRKIGHFQPALPEITLVLGAVDACVLELKAGTQQ